MGETLTDLSQLTRSMVKAPKPVEVKPEPVVVEHNDGDDVLAYFSKAPSSSTKSSEVAPVVHDERIAALEEALTAKDEVLTELAAEKVAAEEKASELEMDLQQSKDAQVRLQAEIDRLKGEVACLQQKAQESAEKGAVCAPEDERAVPPLEPEKPTRGLLAPISGIDEIFPGELREVVISALAEARDKAEQSGRERRAALLGKLLDGNTLSGELDRRRNELRQILKDAGSFTDSHTIGALEKLGFKLISGKKHWKLEYGNVRMPLSKTPSDYRSNRNSANEIANKCF